MCVGGGGVCLFVCFLFVCFVWVIYFFFFFVFFFFVFFFALSFCFTSFTQSIFIFFFLGGGGGGGGAGGLSLLKPKNENMILPNGLNYFDGVKYPNAIKIIVALVFSQRWFFVHQAI